MPISNVPLKRCSIFPAADEIRKSDTEYIDITSLSHPVKGMRLAVIPFLSNNGKTTSLVRCCTGEPVGFDVVLGKHLLICCVSPPLSTTTEVHNFQALMDAYSDLPRDKFEMVLVATSDSSKAAFHGFCSELPCLAIPFSDLDTRHSICSFIDVEFPTQYTQLPAILVDPEETVLHYLLTPNCFQNYGSEWFPFRDSDIEAIRIQDMVLRCRLDPVYKKRVQGVAPEAVMRDALIDEPLSLYRDILLCEPSLAIPRIGSIGGADESVTVLELSKKHVGLYLCLEQGCGCLQDLISLHQECIEKNLEFEILVVFIPLLDPTNSYPEEFVEDLRCRRNITSWLIFPKHNKVWRRLWRVFSLELLEDRLIILPPDGKFGELEGRGVIEQLGITAYPFTRSTILERRFNSLRSLTPASLFKGTSKNRTCLTRNGKNFNVRYSFLEGKKLLVYLDWLQFSDDQGKLCRRLMKLYPKIKAKGWEVVFVTLDRKYRRPHEMYAKMPWPIMPIQQTCETCVPYKLIFEGEVNYGNQVIAFRKDGKIVSREVMKDLMKNKLSGSMFRDNMYEEMAANLACFRG